jgi:hypothetical protein
MRYFGLLGALIAAMATQAAAQDGSKDIAGMKP